ncbi:MAG: O-antigen ligase family protein [Pseudomonas sp.]
MLRHLRPLPSRHAIADFILCHCLPLGWFALLTGLFWVGDRTRYHSLYYLCLAAPTALVLLLQPRWLTTLRPIGLVRLFLLFAAYMLLSLAWSDSTDSLLGLSKRPLYIALLFATVVMLSHRAPTRLIQASNAAAWVAVAAALLSIARYWAGDDHQRLPGYGALYNPLLSAHVYGFFAAYWLCRWYRQANAWHWPSLLALGVLGALLLLTGSRTPLMALAACLLWLGLLHWRRRLWLFVPGAVLMVLAWQLLPTEGVLSRGLSYRPAIWAEVWRQMDGHLLVGHGLGSPQVFKVAGLPEALADTHNMELGVLFEGGLLGLGLWLLLYGHALVYAWRQRQRTEVLMASTLVVFGLVAGFTEGSAFFSRPKEHWFLLWIPLALLAAPRPKQA